MGAFNTKTLLQGNPSLIPTIAERIEQSFVADGFQTKRDNLISGGEEIFVTKGGFFKEILGMRTALKVTLVPQDGLIAFEAGIGIFGQQAIPTLLSLFVAWPVLLTQIWGLVQQAELDDKALEVANSVIAETATPYIPFEASNQSFKFCTSCGTRVSISNNYCPNCGSKLSIL